MKRLLMFLSLMVLLGLLGAQCGVQPASVTVVETVVVKETVEVEKEVVKEVIQTVEVIQEVEVPSEPPPPGPEGTLTVALSTFPNSIDLPQSAERNSHNASWQLYDSLVFADDEGKIVPALAESWEISEDGTEYTFELREDVTFHNGEPFDAESVVFSWERGRQPEMEWSEKWTMADSVEAIDDYTVKVTTDGPKPLLLRTMTTFWAMVPPDYVEEVGESGFAENPVGTGPFMFEEWAKGDHITYKANPDYWREGLPKIETLIFRPIPESATRTAAIQTGEVDIVGRLSSDEAQSLLGVPDVKVIRYPVARVYYIAFNNLTTGVGEPTEDPLVRQAMNYAVDVDTIIDALFDGFAQPATGFVASGELGYGAVEPFGYDPERAEELLAEAGYPDGFEMDMACPAGAYTHFEEVCEAVVGYLADVGIEIDLQIMESGQYWELEANKELPPLFGDSWSEISGEAYNRMVGALGGMDASYSAWSDPEIDRLLEEISVTVDEEERTALYVELQEYMKENPPFIYLYEPMTFEAINTRVQNYQPRPAEDYFLMRTWVVPEEE
jgi:peptide/nickel transport system substrate-binding protein